MIFKKRITIPSMTDKNYINYTKGGYNTSVIIDKGNGFVMPNCVGYAQGRLLELTSATKVNWKLPACNAEDWIDKAKSNGLEVGNEPKLGAVICWKQGNTKNANDGVGHVAIVEEIKANGDLLVSMSQYGGTIFSTMVITKASGYAYKDYQLQGFVYCGIEFEAEKPKDYTEAIHQAYIDCLGRLADDSGMANYQNYLRNGGKIEDMVNSLKASKECSDTKDMRDKEFFVIECYRNILGRFPECEEVVDFWKRHSKEDIFKGIWNSEEAKNRR